MTWDEYKEQVKSTDPLGKQLIEEAEIEAHIVASIIRQRHNLGMSQHELAELCELPQSSIEKIEANKTMPRLDTLARIFYNLGLTVTVAPKPIPIKAS